VFSTGGATTVTLTATGPGGTDTETLVITPASSASFTMTVSGNPITSAYEATTISFTSTSGGSPTTFSWDFDFTANPGVLTASGSSVSRTFTNTTSSTRTFTVRLVVNGPGGPAATQRTLTIVSDTESVTLTATRDNTIYQELTSNSNGDGTRMVVGRTAGTSSGSTASLSRRGLVQFNVSSIPANSTVSSATMSLTADTPALTGPQTITVHRLTSAWTEGNAAATGSSALAAAGVGAATSNGGATWNNRSFSNAWSTAGGDFAASSGSFSVDDVGTYNSTSLATDVQAWVNGTTNNGWLLRGTEASAFTVKRFRTREAITGAPTLTVVYTRPLP
jgi:PKD repeat protein